VKSESTHRSDMWPQGEVGGAGLVILVVSPEIRTTRRSVIPLAEISSANSRSLGDRCRIGLIASARLHVAALSPTTAYCARQLVMVAISNPSLGSL
jgi:hypothetical protein